MSHNVTGKNDQLVMFASRLLNIAKQNYSTTKREALTMVFVLHKFKHYLLGNNIFHENREIFVLTMKKKQ